VSRGQVDSRGVPYEVRSRWTNHTGNQAVYPLRRYDATSLDDLANIVREAHERGTTVRAVGSGHSWSDVALNGGFLVETHRLNRSGRPDASLIREGVDTRHLYWTEAGIRLKELNEALAGQGLGLANMGGYDHQTMAGVMATATHGSGISFGPIADFARSIELVASGGRRLRVEPRQGITDPDRFGSARPDWELWQDDHWFDAVRVGMGCMGLVYSVVLEVSDAFYLKEERTKRPWSQVREDLHMPQALDRTDVLGSLHYEVLMNPYRRDGDNACLITTRTIPEDPHPKRPADRRRNSLPELLAGSKLTPVVSRWLFRTFPRWSPAMLDFAVDQLADENFTSASYKVLNIGAANLLPAYSAEIGVPVDEEDTHVAAVERVLEVSARHVRDGDTYETSPISLRFVDESSAYMAMMNGRRTMMIELIQMTGTDGGFELLADYEEALYELGGRPHWGQVNTLTGSHDLLREMYGEAYDAWLDVHARIDAHGVFDSPFSKRVGISESRFGRTGP
jgi:hypothetical protein